MPGIASPSVFCLAPQPASQQGKTQQGGGGGGGLKLGSKHLSPATNRTAASEEPVKPSTDSSSTNTGWGFDSDWGSFDTSSSPRQQQQQQSSAGRSDKAGSRQEELQRKREERRQRQQEAREKRAAGRRPGGLGAVKKD